MESYVSLKRKGKVCRDYMEKIMNEENDWHHNVEGDAVVCVSGVEVSGVVCVSGGASGIK